MNSKTLMKLAVLTLVVVLAAFAVRQFQDNEGSADELGETLFPSVKEQLNEITEVRVTKGEDAFTVKREDGKWVMADKGGYPAKAESVKEVISGLAFLKPVEPKTSNPKLYDKLGVEEPTADNEATLVELRDASGSKIAGVILGEQNWSGGSSRIYVRDADDKQAWLAEGNLRTAADANSWLESEIMNMPNDRFARVEIQHADGERVEVQRTAFGENTFEVLNLPDGMKLKYGTIANSIGTAMGYLNMEDVQASADFEAPGEATIGQYQAYDGMVLDVKTFKDGETSYCTFAASYNPDLRALHDPKFDHQHGEGADVGHEHDDEVEDDHTHEDTRTPEADVQAEVDELNAALSPWVFQVASYKSDNFSKRMSDLADPDEPVEPEIPAETEQPAETSEEGQTNTEASTEGDGTGESGTSNGDPDSGQEDGQR